MMGFSVVIVMTVPQFMLLRKDLKGEAIMYW